MESILQDKEGSKSPCLVGFLVVDLSVRKSVSRIGKQRRFGVPFGIWNIAEGGAEEEMKQEDG